MLIHCTSCQSKIRVPDSAAGKKGKCPKCGTVLVIPAPEQKPPDEPAAPALADEVPEVEVKEASVPPKPRTAYAAAVPPAIPSSPPPVPKASRRDDDEIQPSRGRDEDDRPRRSRADDDDYDDDRPRRSRRDEDVDDEPRYSSRDDDDLNIRRSSRKQESSAMSLTAMILGISGLVVSLGSSIGGTVVSLACCCGVLGAWVGLGAGGLLALGAVIFGFIGMNQGSKGFAMTGLITGGITLLLIIAYIVLTLIFGAAMIAFIGAQPQPGPPPFRRF